MCQDRNVSGSQCVRIGMCQDDSACSLIIPYAIYWYVLGMQSDDSLCNLLICVRGNTPIVSACGCICVCAFAYDFAYTCKPKVHTCAHAHVDTWVDVRLPHWCEDIDVGCPLYVCVRVCVWWWTKQYVLKWVHTYPHAASKNGAPFSCRFSPKLNSFPPCSPPTPQNTWHISKHNAWYLSKHMLHWQTQHIMHWQTQHMLH